WVRISTAMATARTRGSRRVRRTPHPATLRSSQARRRTASTARTTTRTASWTIPIYARAIPTPTATDGARLGGISTAMATASTRVRTSPRATATTRTRHATRTPFKTAEACETTAAPGRWAVWTRPAPSAWGGTEAASVGWAAAGAPVATGWTTTATASEPTAMA